MMIIKLGCILGTILVAQSAAVDAEKCVGEQCAEPGAGRGLLTVKKTRSVVNMQTNEETANVLDEESDSADSGELQELSVSGDALHENLSVLHATIKLSGIPFHFHKRVSSTASTKVSTAEFIQMDADSDDKWILDFPKSWTDKQLHSYGKELVASGLTDLYEGHPDHGLSMMIVSCSQTALKAYVKKNPGPEFVEQDFKAKALGAISLEEQVQEQDSEAEEGEEIANSSSARWGRRRRRSRRRRRCCANRRRRGSESAARRRNCKFDVAAYHRRRSSGCAAVLPWGLDRIDDKSGKDGSYSSGQTNPGSGVHVFVFDTGIRFTHNDFEGRAKPFYDAIAGKSCSDDDNSCAYDKHGHGTHCAGTVGGKNNGVANKVSLWSVKVLDDNGAGTGTAVLMGMDAVVNSDKRPAVMSMSLGGPGSSSSVKRSIDAAVDDGIAVVVAAGNDNSDASNFWPAYVPSALTVGSVTSSDTRSSFSNYGDSLDIWAPGSDIVSAGIEDDQAVSEKSGTSMACPHVAGAVALLLGEDDSLTPDDLRDSLLESANEKVIKADSTNKMLYVR